MSAGDGAIAPLRSVTARDVVMDFLRARLTSANREALKLTPDFVGRTWGEGLMVRLVVKAIEGDVSAARLVLEFVGERELVAPGSSEPLKGKEDAVADPTRVH